MHKPLPWVSRRSFWTKRKRSWPQPSNNRKHNGLLREKPHHQLVWLLPPLLALHNRVQTHPLLDQSVLRIPQIEIMMVQDERIHPTFVGTVIGGIATAVAEDPTIVLLMADPGTDRSWMCTEDAELMIDAVKYHFVTKDTKTTGACDGLITTDVTTMITTDAMATATVIESTTGAVIMRRTEDTDEMTAIVVTVGIVNEGGVEVAVGTDVNAIDAAGTVLRLAALREVGIDGHVILVSSARGWCYL
jgi:hypothetical protein